MDTDILFPVRNNFYLGAFQAAIAEAADLDTLSEPQRVERDVLVYCSYIELGSYELVINEVLDSSPQALQAVRLLAQYAGNKVEKDLVLSTLQDWVGDPSSSSNATLLWVAGMVYSNEGKHAEALKACHTGLSLEMLAAAVQVCLKMNRVDQAEKHLKVMSGMDEDATLTQLATAWINLELGGAKVQEAFFIYQELGERYTWTVRLHNSSAVCNMRMGNWEDAEKHLQTAYEKDAKNPETIANLICTGLHMGKNVSRYTNQMKTVAPMHAMVQHIESGDALFTRAANGLVAG